MNEIEFLRKLSIGSTTVLGYSSYDGMAESVTEAFSKEEMLEFKNFTEFFNKYDTDMTYALEDSPPIKNYKELLKKVWDNFKAGKLQWKYHNSQKVTSKTKSDQIIEERKNSHKREKSNEEKKEDTFKEKVEEENEAVDTISNMLIDFNELNKLTFHQAKPEIKDLSEKISLELNQLLLILLEYVKPDKEME
jgi:hypothetical protein